MKEQQEKQALLGGQLARHIAKYNESHKNPVNRVFHYVGIPLAAISTLGLLSKVGWPGVDVDPWLRPNLAMVFIALVGGWYVRCKPLAGFILLGIGVGGYLVGSLMPVWALLAMAAVGIICHAIGHYRYEGKPPQLLTRPVSIIEAPVWLLAMLFGLDPAAKRQDDGAPMARETTRIES
jgi:uncharacterized membrane protein YGL010W